MKLEGYVYCEGPDCEHHWHAGLTRFDGRTLVGFPPGWIVLAEHGDGAEVAERSFCGYDCTMKFCAQLPPPEVIPLHDESA